MSMIGNFSLYAAFIASILSGISFLLASSKASQKYFQQAGVLGLLISFVALFAACALIVVGFFTYDISLQYVAQHYPKDAISLKWLYVISGLWGGREGSLLFWTFLISLFSLLCLRNFNKGADKLNLAALMIVQIVLALFIGTLIFSSSNNPFVPTPAHLIGPEGQLIGPARMWGMNRLLEHWAMVLHPPTLFIGYAGLTIPFAYAMAALIVKDVSKTWVFLSERLTVFSWALLTIGIALGAVWAYVVLGWGGFWGWDPVENASLLSWLSSTAMLHSFSTYRQRSSYKTWSFVLAAASFIFVVMGTFITRSGIVQSVHAFAEDQVSTIIFLAIMLLVALLCAVLLVLRKDLVKEEDDIESLFSKNAAYYLTNVLLLASALLLAYLTLVPALPAPLPLAGSVVDVSTYEMAARPIGIILLAICAVCPLLAWSKTNPREFLADFKPALTVGLIIFVALIAHQYINLVPNYAHYIAAETNMLNPSGLEQIYHHVLASIALLVASLLITNSLYLILRDVRRRAQRRDESFARALVGHFKLSPARASGFLTHAAMGLLLIGLVGSSMYINHQIVNVAEVPGQAVEAGGYSLIYKNTNLHEESNGDQVLRAALAVSKDGKSYGEVVPSVVIPNGMMGAQQLLHADIISHPLEDIFVAVQGYSANQELVVSLNINPLINFVWAGSLLLIISGVLAVIPRRKKLG